MGWCSEVQFLSRHLLLFQPFTIFLALSLQGHPDIHFSVESSFPSTECEDQRENKCTFPQDGFNSHKLHKSLAGSCSPFAGGSKSAQYSSASPSVKRRWGKGRRLAGVTNEDNISQLQGVNVLINGCSEAAHVINLDWQHSLLTHCLQTKWFSHF